jgi:hypothetical protein
MTKLKKFTQFAIAFGIGSAVGGLVYGNPLIAFGLWVYTMAVIAVVIHSEGNV